MDTGFTSGSVSSMLEDSQTNSSASKSWVAVAVMFAVGLAGGAVAVKYGPAVGYWFASSVTRSDSTPPKADDHVAPQRLNSTETAESKEIAAPTASPVERELKTLREEIAQLRAERRANLPPSRGQSSTIVPLPAAENPSSADKQRATGQLTLTYWNELNAIMAHEAGMRSAPPQLTAGNALGFVSGRTEAFEYAAEAIRKLNSRGVDADVAALAGDIADWYEQGIVNSRQAETLLESDDTESRRGQPGQNWRAAEELHRVQCLQINRRGEQLRQSLTRKYGLPFPKLQ